MAETVQSLEGLASLKPAAPEAPKYVQKLDAQGRAYATGKRKNAVARVWIKPGSGKILVNTKTVEAVLRAPGVAHADPAAAGRRQSHRTIRRDLHGFRRRSVGPSRRGASRLSKALTYFEPDLRGALKKGGFLTRDSRVVERKKYGRAKARRSFQFSKR